MEVCLLLQFLDFFLKGNLSLECHPRKKPHEWLPEQGWQDLMKLTELAANKGQGGESQALSCALCSKYASCVCKLAVFTAVMLLVVASACVCCISPHCAACPGRR